jgi:hypothetical protein
VHPDVTPSLPYTSLIGVPIETRMEKLLGRSTVHATLKHLGNIGRPINDRIILKLILKK